MLYQQARVSSRNFVSWSFERKRLHFRRTRLFSASDSARTGRRPRLLQRPSPPYRHFSDQFLSSCGRSLDLAFNNTPSLSQKNLTKGCYRPDHALMRAAPSVFTSQVCQFLRCALLLQFLSAFGWVNLLSNTACSLIWRYRETAEQVWQSAWPWKRRQSLAHRTVNAIRDELRLITT